MSVASMNVRDDSSTRAGSVADRSRVSSVAEQIHSSYLRASLLRQAEEKKARKVRFYRNGDKFYRGAVYAVSPERFRTFDSLLAELTRSPICDPKLMPNGVRYIFSLDGTRKIVSLDELAEGESYVCATLDVFKDIDYTKSFDPAAWHQSGRGARSGAAAAAGPPPQPPAELPPLAGPARRQTPALPGASAGGGGGGDQLAGGDATAFDEATFVEQIKPRLITVVRAGPRPRTSVRIPLNKRTARSHEQVLRGISDIVRLDSGAVKRMYTLSGKQVLCLADFFLEDTIFLAYGNERPVHEDFQLDASEVRLVCAYRFSASARIDRITLRSQSSSRTRPLNLEDTNIVDQYMPHVRSQPASPMGSRRHLKTAAADVRPRPGERADSEGRRPSSYGSDKRLATAPERTRESDDQSRTSSRHAADGGTSQEATSDAGNEAAAADGEQLRTGASSAAASDRYEYEADSPSADVQSGMSLFEADSSQSPRTDEDGESLPLEDVRDPGGATADSHAKGSSASDATPVANSSKPSELEPPRVDAGEAKAEGAVAKQRHLANGHAVREQPRGPGSGTSGGRAAPIANGHAHRPKSAADPPPPEQTAPALAAGVSESENGEQQQQQQQRTTPTDASAKEPVPAVPVGSQTSLTGGGVDDYAADAERSANGSRSSIRGSRSSISARKQSPTVLSPDAVQDSLLNHPDDADAAEADYEMISRRYHVSRTIAEEGPVTIKECTSRDSGLLLALKIIEKSRCDPEELRAVAKEVGLLRDVKHANIIGLVEEFETTRARYLVMDLDKGSDIVSALLSAAAYSEADAGRLFGDLISALKYLHSRNILHCNVNMDSLLVVGASSATGSDAMTSPSTAWRLKLGGFHAATVIDIASSEPAQVAQDNPGGDGTSTDVSPAVPSPQHKRYEMDLRGAGQVLWTLLTGRAPPSDDRLTLKDHFGAPDWSGISQEAIDLVAALLGVNESGKISTADEVLLHPWLVSLTSTDQSSETYHEDRKDLVVQNMKASFRQKPKYSNKTMAISILMASHNEERVEHKAKKALSIDSSSIEPQVQRADDSHSAEKSVAVSGKGSHEFLNAVESARTSSAHSNTSQLISNDGKPSAVTAVSSGDIQDESTAENLDSSTNEANTLHRGSREEASVELTKIKTVDELADTAARQQLLPPSSAADNYGSDSEYY